MSDWYSGEPDPFDKELYDAKKEIARLRQRVAELEAAYAERGERMKALWREYENGPTKEFRMEVCDWFDEAGEPL